MKKLLSILGALSFTALASTSVVACSKEEAPKTPESLNGKTFEVALDSLVGSSINLTKEPTKKDSPQLQWGEKSIGFLYSTLWSINNKPAIEDGYFIQNKEVAQYLTKGEAVVRGIDDGSNVTINGKTISEILEENELDDWHKIILEEGNKVVFDVVINSYKGAEVITTTDAEITINLI